MPDGSNVNNWLLTVESESFCRVSLNRSAPGDPRRDMGDILDVTSLSKLIKKHDGPGEIAEIIKTLAKYGDG